MGGGRRVEGLNGLTEGSLDQNNEALRRAKERRFL